MMKQCRSQGDREKRSFREFFAQGPSKAFVQRRHIPHAPLRSIASLGGTLLKQVLGGQSFVSLYKKRLQKTRRGRQVSRTEQQKFTVKTLVFCRCLIMLVSEIVGVILNPPVEVVVNITNIR